MFFVRRGAPGEEIVFRLKSVAVATLCVASVPAHSEPFKHMVEECETHVNTGNLPCTLVNPPRPYTLAFLFERLREGEKTSAESIEELIRYNARWADDPSIYDDVDEDFLFQPDERYAIMVYW